MPCFVTVNTEEKKQSVWKQIIFYLSVCDLLVLVLYHLPCCPSKSYLTQIEVQKRLYEQGKLLLSIMLQRRREFMTLKRWKFSVTEHLTVTSFEGKRARTRFPWAINKLRRFKYLSVWGDDELLLLSVWGSIAETEPVNAWISAAKLSHACSKAHCTLTVTFPWMPTPSFGVLSAVQSQFQAWWFVSE